MGKTVVYISDPKDAETVYKAEGKYPKRVIPQFKAIEKYYKSKNMSLVSLVQLENEEWNKLHKVLAPKMLRPGFVPSSPLGSQQLSRKWGATLRRVIPARVPRRCSPAPDPATRAEGVMRQGGMERTSQ